MTNALDQESQDPLIHWYTNDGDEFDQTFLTLSVWNSIKLHLPRPSGLAHDYFSSPLFEYEC